MTRNATPRVKLGRSAGQSGTPPAQPPPKEANVLMPVARSLVMQLAAGAARAMDDAACAVSGGARLIERLADLGMPPVPARTALRLQAAVGETLVRDVLVTNPRASRVAGALASTDWYTDTEARAASEIVSFEPSAVDLSFGATHPIRTTIRVPADLVDGAIYRATFFVVGSTYFRLPVELHVGKLQTAVARRGRRR